MPRAATSVATQTAPGVAQILSARLRWLGCAARQRDCRERTRRGWRRGGDIVAGRAEQHRRFRLVEAEEVDHGMLDLGGRDGERLVGNVTVAAILIEGRDAQRVALEAAGEGDDRLGQGG